MRSPIERAEQALFRVQEALLDALVIADVPQDGDLYSRTISTMSQMQEIVADIGESSPKTSEPGPLIYPMNNRSWENWPTSSGESAGVRFAKRYSGRKLTKKMGRLPTVLSASDFMALMGGSLPNG